jgi:hypothetical protein
VPRPDRIDNRGAAGLSEKKAPEPAKSARLRFRLCRFPAPSRRWNFDDHWIILEKPLLDILPLGGWDHARPPSNACGFVVLGHYVAEVVEYSDSGGAVGSLKMKLRSRQVCFCHEVFVILDGRISPAGYKSFRCIPYVELCRRWLFLHTHLTTETLNPLSRS